MYYFSNCFIEFSDNNPPFFIKDKKLSPLNDVSKEKEKHKDISFSNDNTNTNNIKTNEKKVKSEKIPESNNINESNPFIKNIELQFHLMKQEFEKQFKIMNEKLNMISELNFINSKEIINSQAIENSRIEQELIDIDEPEKNRGFDIDTKHKHVKDNKKELNTNNHDNDTNVKRVYEVKFTKDLRFNLCKTQDKKLVSSLFEFVKKFKYLTQFIVTNKLVRHGTKYYIYMIYSENSISLSRYIKKMEFLYDLTPENGLEYIKDNNSCLLYRYPKIANLEQLKIIREGKIEKNKKLAMSSKKSRGDSAETDIMTDYSQINNNLNSVNLLRKKQNLNQIHQNIKKNLN